MRLLLLALLLLVVPACGRTADPATPSPVAGSGSPASASPVVLTDSDFVEWGEGGGIDGRWTGHRVHADGRLEVMESISKTTTTRLGPAAARRILQAAVDAGVPDLRNYPPRGADMISQGIHAKLGGKEVRASRDDMTRDADWDRAWSALNAALEEETSKVGSPSPAGSTQP